MIKLIWESWISPFFIKPVGLFLFFLCCIVGVKKFNKFFLHLEADMAIGRVLFLKTIYFNLRSLPFKQAIKFPIFIYSKTQIVSTSGSIKFECDKVMSGMVKWGVFDGFRCIGKTRINNYGQIILKGKGKIYRGNEICVYDVGKLIMDDDFYLAENTMIYCHCLIRIGKHLRFAYHSQIIDSDFHYTVNINTGEVQKFKRAIEIGDYNWIANKTTIKKGTKTPNHTTVAGSYSVLCKDYTKDIPEYSIIGGVPAKLIVTGYSRLWNNEDKRIHEINDWFENNPDEKVYKYDIKNIKLTNLTENEG